MAKSSDLMGLGFASAQANAIGFTLKAITAAGTTSADATACDAQSTFFNVTATGSDGIRMSSSAPLLTPIVVANPSGSNGVVYPHTGGTVNGGSTDAGETIATTTVQIWFRISSTAWVAVLGA
jgi:hypothetical protein